MEATPEQRKILGLYIACLILAIMLLSFMVNFRTMLDRYVNELSMQKCYAMVMNPYTNISTIKTNWSIGNISIGNE